MTQEQTWRWYASLYRKQGWTNTLPVRHGTKGPPPEGFTGWTGRSPGPAELEQWEQDYGNDAGLAVRLTPIVLGIDVDDYGTKQGGKSLAEREAQWGPLPPTWVSSARTDGVSGIRFFRVPPKLKYPGQAGRDIETIHYGHRYAVVWPSRHPEGGLYIWRGPDGAPAAPPMIGQLPELPAAWVEGLTANEVADPAAKAEVDGMGAVHDWITEREGAGPPCACCVSLGDQLDEAIAGDDGSRHDRVNVLLVPVVRAAERGCSGISLLVEVAAESFVKAVPRDDAHGEFQRMLKGAVAIVMADPHTGSCPDGWLDSLPEAKPAPTPSVDDGVGDDGDDRKPWEKVFNIQVWKTAWDDDTEEDWIIPPLLARGRSVALYSPPKVGKSLLTLEVAAAVATGRDVLGTGVQQCKVLYVDMENDMRGDVIPRLKRLGYTPDVLHNLFYASFPQIGTLDEGKGAERVIAAVAECGAEVVIFDTVSRLISGEENANDTWLAFYRNVGAPLKAKRVAILRLDHTGKDETKGMRGGSAKYGDVDAVWKLKKITAEGLTLELEANRMPVAEKFVTLNRTDGAVLRHDVKSGGWGAASDMKMDLWIKILDEDGVPLDASGRDVLKAIRAREVKIANGKETKVIEERKRRNFMSTLTDSSAPISKTEHPVGEALVEGAPSPVEQVAVANIDTDVSAGQSRSVSNSEQPRSTSEQAPRATAPSPPSLGGGAGSEAVSRCLGCGQLFDVVHKVCPDCGVKVILI